MTDIRAIYPFHHDQLPSQDYRGWSVHYDPKPIPIRNCDWTATHPDYDASYEGEEDGWIDNGLKACAATYEELCDEIDALQDEWDEANGQFGVGA